MTLKVVPKPAAPGYRMQARGADRAEIYLYGVIGETWFGDGISAKRFADDLKGLGKVKTIDLRINSEGGDVHAARAMYSLLVAHAARVIVHIDGLAASAASVVAMAGDEVEIAEGGFLMIHEAWTVAGGRAADFRRAADLLDTVNEQITATYAARTKADVAQIKAWMEAETWFTGAEAVAAGFADRAVDNLKVAASVSNPTRFRNLPSALRPRRAAAQAMSDKLAAVRR